MEREEEQPFPLDIPIPATYGEALRGLANPSRLLTQRYQEQQWRADRAGAHPDILEFERVFVRRMAKLGVPVFASEVIRTRKRQDELFALGNSRAKAGQSAHQYGCAVDIVHSVKGWALAPKEWALIGHVGKELIAQKGFAMESKAWGGDWSFYDPAHWQLTEWKAIAHRQGLSSYPWPKVLPWYPGWEKDLLLEVEDM